MNSTKLQKRVVSDLQQVLKTAAGRRVLWRILQAAQVRQHGFVPGDELATVFHCGQRSIGLFLLEEIEQANATAYQQMRSEYQAEVTALQHQVQQETDHE
ncbi:MAG: hypothetical protein II913_02640 [Elusimicrobiaceae bacterium]|nr:hypothetical protein [Elusimicrobiaceae bacterium]